MCMTDKERQRRLLIALVHALPDWALDSAQFKKVAIELTAMAFSDEPKEDAAPKQHEPEKPKTKRKGIDEGKMLALHKAGWTNTKIAGELGVSPAAIGQRLRRIKDEENNTSDD